MVITHFFVLDQLYGSSGSFKSQSTTYGSVRVPDPRYVRSATVGRDCFSTSWLQMLVVE